MRTNAEYNSRFWLAPRVIEPKSMQDVWALCRAYDDQVNDGAGEAKP